MLVGIIRAGKSLEGYVERGLVDTTLIHLRHTELAYEMAQRAGQEVGQHASPLPEYTVVRQGQVDIDANVRELARRCPDCRRRLEQVADLTGVPKGGDALVRNGSWWRVRFSGQLQATRHSNRAAAQRELYRLRESL